MNRKHFRIGDLFYVFRRSDGCIVNNYTHLWTWGEKHLLGEENRDASARRRDKNCQALQNKECGAVRRGGIATMGNDRIRVRVWGN